MIAIIHNIIGSIITHATPHRTVNVLHFIYTLAFAYMEDTNNTTNSGTSKRGFASMDPDKQRAIASKGGQAAHAKGTAHEFTSEEAREAGRKGGKASHGSKQIETENEEETGIPPTM